MPQGRPPTLQSGARTQTQGPVRRVRAVEAPHQDPIRAGAVSASARRQPRSRAQSPPAAQQVAGPTPRAQRPRAGQHLSVQGVQRGLPGALRLATPSRHALQQLVRYALMRRQYWHLLEHVRAPMRGATVDQLQPLRRSSIGVRSALGSSPATLAQHSQSPSLCVHLPEAHLASRRDRGASPRASAVVSLGLRPCGLPRSARVHSLLEHLWRSATYFVRRGLQSGD